MNLEEFVKLADSKTHITGYAEIEGQEENVKNVWLKAGRTILRDVAKALELPKGSYEVRINAGGPAVSGEVILHGEWIYVQLSQTSHGVLWRFCNGRKDYVGSSNHWYKWCIFNTAEGFAAFISLVKSFADESPEAKKKIDSLF